MEVAMKLAVLKSGGGMQDIIRIAGFWQCKYLVGESEMFVKDKKQDWDQNGWHSM